MPTIPGEVLEELRSNLAHLRLCDPERRKLVARTAFLDTTTPQGELIFTVMASLAQFESALISERVKAGMARAKAQGKRISRAPIAEEIQARMAALYAEGISLHQISKQVGIGYGTAWNDVQRAK